MGVWIDREFKDYYNDSNKKGIRLHFDKDVNAELRQECINFCKWLRKRYWFPIRCNIYFLNRPKIKCRDGSKSSAKIIHYDCNEDGIVDTPPSIYIAVGLYEKEIQKYSKRNLVFGYLGSIVHELTHYFQWYFFEFNDLQRTQRSLEYNATLWKNYLLNKYWDELYGEDET